MALPKLLDEAATRMRDAAFRIDEAQRQPLSLESLRDWLAALTDYAQALADVHQCTNESVHEKLHALAGHVGLEKVLDRS